MIIGHEQKIETLNALLEKDAFPQALMFWGPEHVGKYTLAQELARGLLCFNRAWNGCTGKRICDACKETADAHITRELFAVDREARERMKQEENIDLYDIKGMRRVIAFLDAKPALARKKVVVIDDAHLLDPKAQNALLKTVEELPPYAHVIFVTHKPTALFDTVRSRLTQLAFGLVDAKKITRWLKQYSDDEMRIQKAVTYSFLRPGKAYALITGEHEIRDFERVVKALLSLEQKPIGAKLALIANYREKGIWEQESLFALWQAVLRDELMFDINMKQYALLLTRTHTAGSMQKHLKALRMGAELEHMTDEAPNALALGVELLATAL